MSSDFTQSPGSPGAAPFSWIHIGVLFFYLLIAIMLRNFFLSDSSHLFAIGLLTSKVHWIYVVHLCMMACFYPCRWISLVSAVSKVFLLGVFCSKLCDDKTFFLRVLKNPNFSFRDIYALLGSSSFIGLWLLLAREIYSAYDC